MIFIETNPEIFSILQKSFEDILKHFSIKIVYF